MGFQVKPPKGDCCPEHLSRDFHCMHVLLDRQTSDVSSDPESGSMSLLRWLPCFWSYRHSCFTGSTSRLERRERLRQFRLPSFLICSINRSPKRKNTQWQQTIRNEIRKGSLLCSHSQWVTETTSSWVVTLSIDRRDWGISPKIASSPVEDQIGRETEAEQAWHSPLECREGHWGRLSWWNLSSKS